MALIDLTSIVKPIVDRVSEIILKQQEKGLQQIELEKLKKEMEVELYKLTIDYQKNYYDFFIRYEGEAEKMPRIIQILRGSFRTIVSYLFMLIFIFFILQQTFNWNFNIKLTDDFMFIFKLVVAFWFGDRLVMHFLEGVKK